MLKDHRKIQPVMLVKIGRKVYKTPRLLAQSLAADATHTIYTRLRARGGQPDYGKLYDRAFRRIFPHCQWFYNRK